MPLDAGGAKPKLASRKETFRRFLVELTKVDFNPIVYFLQREDKNHWTESKALSELENFKSFFALRGVVKFSMVPTKNIDEVWHACILHTEFYVDLWYFALRQVHSPSTFGWDNKAERKQPIKLSKDSTSFRKKMTGRLYRTTKASDCDCASDDCCAGCNCSN